MGKAKGKTKQTRRGARKESGSPLEGFPTRKPGFRSLASGLFRRENGWMPVLFAAVLIAYVPALMGGFIWDDDYYVTENQTLRSAKGLWHLWFNIGATPQYYPLVFSTFWVEYHLWGLNPFGYHLTNVLLHTLNSLLIFGVLSYLRVPGALLVAVIFGLHPVHVESVAWITERKNVLSCFCYLMSLNVAVRFFRVEPGAQLARAPGSPRSRWGLYVAGLLFYVAALLSKTVTCSLPAIVLVILWWKRDRIAKREALLMAPFFGVGLALGLVTIWMEKNVVGAFGEQWDLSIIDRCLVAGRVLWFYVGKLLWPDPLAFTYPRWAIDSAVAWQYAFPIGVVIVVAGLWFLRGRIGKAPLAAVLFFIITLSPALGFIDVFPMQYSYVADHFQYHASIGMIALLAGIITTLIGLLALQPRRWGYAACGLWLIALAVLTFRQGFAYEGLVPLWEHTIKSNPDSWLAHNNIGCELYEAGEKERGLYHFKESLRANPNYANAHVNFGNTLLDQGKTDQALESYRRATELDSYDPTPHFSIATVMLQNQRLDEAEVHFRKAIELHPKHADALNSLALIRGVQGDDEQAIDYHRRAIEVNPRLTPARVGLGMALARGGQLREAVEQFSIALQIEPNALNARLYLAHALRDLSLLEEAIAEYQRVLAARPDWREAQEGLRKTRARRKR